MGDGGVGLSAAEGGSDAGNDEELYPLSSRLAAQLERLEAFALNCSKAQREAFLLELISNSYHALDDVFFRGIRQGLYVRYQAALLAPCPLPCPLPCLPALPRPASAPPTPLLSRAARSSAGWGYRRA